MYRIEWTSQQIAASPDTINYDCACCVFTGLYLLVESNVMNSQWYEGFKPYVTYVATIGVP